MSIDGHVFMISASVRDKAIAAAAKARYERENKERIMAPESAGLWQPPSWDELKPRERAMRVRREGEFIAVFEAAALERGWKMMDRNPTDDMILNGDTKVASLKVGDVYRAMWDAAPSPGDD